MKTTQKNRLRNQSTWAVIIVVLALIPAGPVQAEDTALPSMYVLDFLAPGSDGIDINESGLVIGSRAIDEGCDPFCVIVPEEIGVWRDADFTALPTLPHWSWAILEGISADGWIVGTAYSDSDIRGIVWKPSGPGYDLLEIPSLPDTTFTTVTGIDDSNRVIGFANRQSPFEHKGFVWTEATGPVELADFGFPSSTPIAISPGGTVAYLYGWYQLDVPGLVNQNTASPDGFGGPGAYVAINDTGDQIRIILPSSGHEIYYPFRYFNNGEWQQLSGGSGWHSTLGVGSVTSDLDISYTNGATGYVAPGPDQPGEFMTDRLSPAYGDTTVYQAGPMTEDGRMVAQVYMGKAPRLVRLVPAEPCTSNCAGVEKLQLRSMFVDDPSDPGSCVGTAHTRSVVRLRVVGENGVPLAGVRVTGRFLTEYRLDGLVTGRTDRRGGLKLRYRSAPCTGMMTFLVTDLEMPGRTFDRTVGVLKQSVLPQ